MKKISRIFYSLVHTDRLDESVSKIKSIINLHKLEGQAEPLAWFVSQSMFGKFKSP